MRHLIVVVTLMVLGLATEAKLHTQRVAYRDGDAVLKGYLAVDDSFKAPRPGVLVVPEWWGLGPYAERRADQLAAMGYVALAADIYGNGTYTRDGQEAAKLSGRFKDDPKLLRSRVTAALEALKKQKGVDPSRIAAIGYCFGGTTVLELARSGAPIAGVVSFHGGLRTSEPARRGEILCKVLVCTGADDPHVPAEDVTSFEEEMRKSGADWQVVAYGGAVHGFTNPENGGDPSKRGLRRARRPPFVAGHGELLRGDLRFCKAVSP
jgi:dienelactone hydrolase